MHRGFYADGLPVAGRPVEDDPTLPGDAQRGVGGAGVEEAIHVGDEGVLEGSGQDDVGPMG